MYTQAIYLFDADQRKVLIAMRLIPILIYVIFVRNQLASD